MIINKGAVQVIQTNFQAIVMIAMMKNIPIWVMATNGWVYTKYPYTEL